MSATRIPVAIGDTVFVAWANAYCQRHEPCPICAGSGFCTLILGSGEQTPVECEFCRRGWDGPSGTITVYEARSGVLEEVVTGIELDERGWIIKTGHRHFNEWDAVVFADRTHAESRAAELMVKAQEQAKANYESQFAGNKKKHTWSVGYHRREIAELERKIEWHRAKLSVRRPRPANRAPK